MSLSQIRGALKRARRRDVDAKAIRILAVLRGEQLGRESVITTAYAAATRSAVAVPITLTEQVTVLQGQVEASLGRHPDAEIIVSQPGMGPILGARVLAEFGDAPGRYADAKARESHLIQLGRVAMGRSSARATARSGRPMWRAVASSHESIASPGIGASRSGSLLLGTTAMRPKTLTSLGPDRDDVQLAKDFLASLREHGVIVPRYIAKTAN